jgi:hypothetical protein
VPPVPLPVTPLPVPPPTPAPAPIAADCGISAVAEPDVTAEPSVADVIAVLAAALEQRDAAIERLTILLTDVRADHAVLAARVDRLDPPDDTPLPGYCGLKEAAFASGFSDETLRRWAKAGLGIKRGGVWQIELASVMERAGRR